VEIDYNQFTEQRRRHNTRPSLRPVHLLTASLTVGYINKRQN